MKRMNLRDVPDEVYDALAEAAQRNRQSLSSFVVERLIETVQVLTLSEHVHSYLPPGDTGISLQDAVDAVNEARRAS